jgi:hypothetical protein
VSERLRYTGANPPPSVWAQFPNWQNAIDEEGEPDQDETTLRPADNQQFIDDDVSFAAGDAEFAEGLKVPALLSLIAGELGWVYVYPEPDRDACWVVRHDEPSQRWVAMNESWFLEGDEGLMPVPLDRSERLRMRVTSRRPLLATGRPLVAEISLSGSPAAG